MEFLVGTAIDHTADTWNRYWKELLEGQAPSNKGTDLTVRKWTDGLIPEIAANLPAWTGERPCGSSNKDVFVVPHKAGKATYLLIANNAQDESNPRGVKHELVPAETEVTIPRGGVVYDLFDGGKVAVADGKAALRLPAGDGACWLHLPAEPGPIAVRAAAEGNDLRITVTWGTEGYLPFRLRVLDPAGNEALNLFRATTPGEGGNCFVLTYALGANAAAGQWTVEASEWLTGGRAVANVEHHPAGGALAQVHQGSVLAYFDDARRIVDLLAGKPLLPPYAKLNWDFPRVWGVEAKKFALFGPTEAAGKIAAALKAKGMTVEVNPDYKIVPFEREPDRGGAGPTFRTDNFENIYAHTIVLPGHKLLEVSAKRGHINRPQTDAFPGPGRACVQWGLSCYQAGWQNVFVQGDLEAGTAWLLEAIQGKAPAAASDLKVQIQAATAKPSSLPDLVVARSVRVYDTPVGAISSANGAATFVLLYDGSARALDKDSRDLWTARPLRLGSALALSPKGDRLAVAGYPGLAVLDAKNGKVLGEQKATPIEGALPIWTANEMVSVAWNSAGTLVAGAWRNTFKGDQKAPRKPLPLALLDADGKALPSPGAPANAFGIAFVPGTDVLLVGADKLTAVDVKDVKVLWTNDVKGAQAFAFSPDGKTAAAGGHGCNVGRFSTQTGNLGAPAIKVPGMVGGVALLPGGDVAVAAWGRTNPLLVIPAGGKEARALFQSAFGFQDVLYSPELKALVAAEQGGRIWLLGADGTPKAMLGDGAGTTAYRMSLQGGAVIVARMNRVVQVLAAR